MRGNHVLNRHPFDEGQLDWLDVQHITMLVVFRHDDGTFDIELTGPGKGTYLSVLVPATLLIMMHCQ